MRAWDLFVERELEKLEILQKENKILKASIELVTEEYERLANNEEILLKDIKYLEELLEGFIQLGRDYDKKLNKFYFYKNSKLYASRQDCVDRERR